MNISLSHVTKYYQDNGKSSKGIEDISLSFDTDSSFVVLTGESGSGKTTLIQVLTGLLDYDEGDISFDGNPLSGMRDEDREKFYQTNISFVFQDYNLVESFTAEENIIIALLKQGKNTVEAKKIADEKLDLVGLKSQKRMKTSRLSGGERQRVAIARSLALDTKVIVFDEPTGNLDQETSKQIISLIHSLVPGGLILYVTHEYQQVADIVTRHIVLADGHVIADEKVNPTVPEEKGSETKEESKEGKFRFSSLLYTSSLFSFRRPGRFIATLLILLLSVASCFGFACGYSAILAVGTNSVGAVYEGTREGTETLFSKNSIEQKDPDTKDAYADYGDLLARNNFYTYDREIATDIFSGKTTDTYSNYCASSFLLPSYGDSYLASAFTLKNEVSATDGSDSCSVILYGDNDVSHNSSYSFYKNLLGKPVSVLPFSTEYMDYEPSEEGNMTPSQFLEDAPKATLTKIYLTTNLAFQFRPAVLFSKEAISKEESLIRKVMSEVPTLSTVGKIEVAGGAKSFSIAQGNKVMEEENANLTGFMKAENKILLSSSWKNRLNELTLKINDQFALSLDKLGSDVFEYYDPDPYDIFRNDYAYGISGDPVGKYLIDNKLSGRIYSMDPSSAVSLSDTLTKDGFGAYRMSKYQKKESTYTGMGNATFGARIGFFFMALGSLAWMFLIMFLLRMILNKFYYRKGGDETVLSYIGYTRKDMMAINLMEFLTIVVIGDVLLYTLTSILIPTVHSFMVYAPVLFALAILLSIFFAFFLSRPLKKRRNK